MKRPPSVVLRRAPALAALAALCGPAAAQSWEASWDNEVRAAALVRLGAPGYAPAGGAAFAVPEAERGLQSGRLEWRSAVNLSRNGFGLRVGGSAWMDLADGIADPYRGPFYLYRPGPAGGDAIVASGAPPLRDRRAQLGDAFIHGATALGADDRLSFRLGRHVSLWGESVYFSGNGIAAAQAPVDAEAVPGGDAYRRQEMFLPVAQLSVSWQPAPGTALQVYYQFEHRRSRLATFGSYGQTVGRLGAEARARADAAVPGGAPVILLPGTRYGAPALGQFGAALKWRTGELGLGLYALRYHAKAPVLALRPSAERLGPYGLGTATLHYPRGIELYGASVAGFIGEAAVAAELSARRHMPFAAAAVVPAPGQAPRAAVPAGESWHALASWEVVLPLLPGGVMWSAELAGNGRLGRPANPGQMLPGRSVAAAAARTVLEPRFFQVLPGVDLRIPVSAGYNLLGRSPVDAAMTRGTGDVSVGLSVDVEGGWNAVVTLTRYLGAAAPASLSYAGSGAGRPAGAGDFLSLTLRRVF